MAEKSWRGRKDIKEGESQKLSAVCPGWSGSAVGVSAVD